MLPRAMSSSSSGAREIQWPRRWARTRASSPRRRASSAASPVGLAVPRLTARAMSSGRSALPGVIRVALAVPSPPAPAPLTPTEMSPWPPSWWLVSVLASVGASGVLTGASRPRSWCSTSRAGNPYPAGTRRRPPWNPGRTRRWRPRGPPRWKRPHCGGCTGRGRCAAPSPHPGRAVTRRGRGKGRGWSGQRLPRWAKRCRRGVRGLSCHFLFCVLLGLLLRVGRCGFAHPGAVLVGFAAAFQPLGVALAAAGDDLVEFVPVQRAVLPLLRFLVETDVLVRQGQSQDLDLLHHHADEAVAQFVVAEALDVPGHRLLGVG